MVTHWCGLSEYPESIMRKVTASAKKAKDRLNPKCGNRANPFFSSF